MLTNTKIAKTLAIAAGALLLPAAAQAETRAFERDGVNYSYVETAENGRTVLVGKADNVPFRLIVRGERVTGRYNSKPVSFTLNQVVRSAEVVAVR